MNRYISKIFGKKDRKSPNKSVSREELKRKVEKGTEKAIKEYGYVFEKLAEFDRT